MGRYVTVDVEVDLGDIDSEDLQSELVRRKKREPNNSKAGVPPLNGDEAHPLHEIYYAFKFGMTDRATELARAYVCDELGVVL